MNANRNPASNSRHQRTSLCRIDISLHFSTSARSHNPAIPGDTPGPSESQQLASVKLGPMSARTSRSVYHFANQSANPLTILHVAPPIEALKVIQYDQTYVFAPSIMLCSEEIGRLLQRSAQLSSTSEYNMETLLIVLLVLFLLGGGGWGYSRWRR